jgi:hypothetical protein
MSRLPEKLLVGTILLSVLAVLLVPDAVAPVFAPAIAAAADGIRWANDALPQPVFIAVIFLLTTGVTIVVAVAFARVGYLIARRAGPRTRRVYNFVTPSTPVGKVGLAFGLTMGVLVGSVWALPYVIGDLGENSSVSDAGNFSNGSESAEDLAEEGFDDDALAVLESDALTGGGSGGWSGDPYRRPTPDADGDRLRDGWESAGVTGDGVRFVDADPARMDVYVQVNYGAGTEPLSAREKRALKRVWAEMPVDNPDGSTGITLHLDDRPRNGGALGESVSVSGADPEEIHTWYTPETLGARQCRYHQLVIGSIESGDVAGVASISGYAMVVESDRRQYDGDVPYRVHVITHELLHNVAGEVDGSYHTSDGWLAPVVDDEETHLSDATAAKLNSAGLSGSGYYQHAVCGN